MFKIDPLKTALDEAYKTNSWDHKNNRTSARTVLGETTLGEALL